ncbi:DUF6089 family protein [Adhaeribacter aquaticus]|uniref:DUF6089 family protein n=1 Tax=Adhaeribacter aquaticus TaxID=299567 RepID=UPI000423D931|nr:DUF6089 family protein [Adhaeribacter aquaticus]
MKKIFSTIILVGILLSLVTTEADAQRWSKRRRYYSLGVNVAAMNYFGDIVPQADFTSLRLRSTRPSLGLTYEYKMYPRVSFRGSLAWGRITGDDQKSASQNEAENLPRFKRNLNFRNDIKELSGAIVIDLFENRGTYTRRPDFAPYGFIGVGLIHHNPKTYYGGGAILPNGQEMAAGYYELQPLGTEGQYSNGSGYPEPYRKLEFVIPFGIGFRYKLDRQWDLGFEIGWRKTFTDYLDDVSTNYASKADLLQSDPSGRAAILSDRSSESGYPSQPDPSGTPYAHVPGYGVKGDQRGDATDKDWYITTGISLNYIIPVRTRGPKFR